MEIKIALAGNPNSGKTTLFNALTGSNLERNLFLTTQLTELGIPVVVAVNMMDVVKKNGDKIDPGNLAKALGCKVVPISALKGDGIIDAARAAVEWIWTTVF